MMNKNIKKQNGFTLVEAIIALFIGSLMLMAIYKTVNLGQSSSSKVERRVSAQQDARGALELMATEIQMASYNPQVVKNIWVDPTSCTNASSNMTYKGIQAATTNSMTIEMDVNGTGVINTTNNPNEIIAYAYDSTNQYITRSTNCGSAQPFLGATNANADTKTALVVNNTAGAGNTAIPVFSYYDGAGNILVPDNTGSIGANIPNIRRVTITLVVDTSFGDIGTGTRRRIIYSTSVIPRNHAVPVFN